LNKTIFFNIFGTRILCVRLHLKTGIKYFGKTLMYMCCSLKAFKWHSMPENFKMIACAEFYCRQIATKLSLVQLRKSTNKQTDMSVQTTATT